MPLYEYQCDACSVRFERVQHVSDEPVRQCPECGGKVHRLIQPVGIIFKGSGFYVTDNRSKSATSSSGSSSSSSSSNGSSKPAAKSETTERSSHSASSGDGKSSSDKK